jgi:hypothetical protein
MNTSKKESAELERWASNFTSAGVSGGLPSVVIHWRPVWALARPGRVSSTIPSGSTRRRAVSKRRTLYLLGGGFAQGGERNGLLAAAVPPSGFGLLGEAHPWAQGTLEF